MIAVYLGLDLSINRTGYSLITDKGDLLEAGAITWEKYKGYTKDRYPVSTIKRCISVVDQIDDLIEEIRRKYYIKKVIVEEINPGGGGTTTIKALSYLHCILFKRFLDEYSYLFETIKVSEWRSKAGVGVVVRRKKGRKYGKDNSHKMPIVDHVNSHFKLNLTVEENDEADAIGMVLGWMYINKIIDKP